MAFDELKERYKMVPLWGRLLGAVVLGLTPAAYIYFDEGEDLEASLVEAQNQTDAARQKFEASRQKKANLPKLEEQLAFTEEQLAKAKKKLPDSYRIEDVLQKAATIAKQTGVRLLAFTPGSEVSHKDPYQYVELPITTEIDGRFNQLAAFFDRVIHLDGSVFLRHLDLKRMEVVEGRRNNDDGSEKVDSYETAKATRQGLKVKGRFDLVVYRSMTPAEVQGAQPPPAENGKAKAPKPPKEGDAAAAAPAEG